MLRLPENYVTIEPPGLLYLPHPYVVPGGRFNEMYGWDSYFILLGLLKDGELALAKGMTANLVYEVERYGKVLNANRTYYLGRSQPPFLTRMVLEVYGRSCQPAYEVDVYLIATLKPQIKTECRLLRIDFAREVLSMLL